MATAIMISSEEAKERQSARAHIDKSRRILRQYASGGILSLRDSLGLFRQRYDAYAVRTDLSTMDACRNARRRAFDGNQKFVLALAESRDINDRWTSMPILASYSRCATGELITVTGVRKANKSSIKQVIDARPQTQPLLAVERLSSLVESR